MVDKIQVVPAETEMYMQVKLKLSTNYGDFRSDQKQDLEVCIASVHTSPRLVGISL